MYTMNTHELEQTATAILSKTILAADESTGTIAKRFSSIGVTSTPEINRQYRQLLFTSPGIEQYVSGIILYDETIRQKTDSGIPFPEYLTGNGIVPGIKVDTGAQQIPGKKTDTYTEGLDGLSERLYEYYRLGARFAKWRAVYTIHPPTSTYPSDIAIQRNAHDLALYALLCQQHNIVPIVEPEVLMEGNHSFEQYAEVTKNVLTAVFTYLNEYGVDMTGMVLKPNMVTSGTGNNRQMSVEQVAQKTLDVLKNTVPSTVPGIAFLSGGQSPDLATEHLAAINTIRNGDIQSYPWRITASYGRALQGEALEAWRGKKENTEKAQKIFIDRAEKVYKASLGT